MKRKDKISCKILRGIIIFLTIELMLGGLVSNITAAADQGWADPPTFLSPGSGDPPGEAIDTLTPTFKWNKVSIADYYGLYMRDMATDELIFDSEKDYGRIYGNSFQLPDQHKLKYSYYRWNMASHSSAGWSYERTDGGKRYSDPLCFTTYIKGIDVSHFQKVIDWSKVWDSGYKFAFIKVTEGTGNLLTRAALSKGTKGVILEHMDNGAYADGYYWWYAEVKSGEACKGCIGWVVEEGLEKVNSDSEKFNVGDEVRLTGPYHLRSTPEIPQNQYVDDKFFIRNMKNAVKAGILVGAYHFAHPDDNEAVSEAKHFIKVAKKYLGEGYLRPVLDLECGKEMDTGKLSKWIHDWINTVKTEVDIEPIIYVNSNYAKNNLEKDISNYNLWIAHYYLENVKSPNIGIWEEADKDWDFWQYSDNGSVLGISDSVDMDLFNGSMNRLRTFMPPPADLWMAKPVLTSPLRITPEKDKYYVGDTLRAEFTIKNIGGALITLDKLLVGGRFNDGRSRNREHPDFTSQTTTLQPDGQYRYNGTLTLTRPGNYHFFIAYYIENPTSEEKKLLDENNWNTCVGLGQGLTDADRIENIRVFSVPPSLSLIFSDDFSSDTGEWTYVETVCDIETDEKKSGSAYLDHVNEHIVLTKSDWQIGVIWFNQEIYTPFAVEFRYKAGGGSGADGLVFMFYKQKDYDPYNGGVLGFTTPPGGSSSSTPVPGYGIEFDNFNNGFDGGVGQFDDPPGNHIALIKDSVGNHLKYVEDPRTEDDQWHNVKIIVGYSTIEVYVDSELVLTWEGRIDRTYGGLGFSGATGYYDNWHIIDDVKILV